MRLTEPKNEIIELLESGLNEKFGKPLFSSNQFIIYHVNGCYGIGVTIYEKDTIAVCAATLKGDGSIREHWTSRHELIVCIANIHEPDSIPRIEIGIKETKRRLLHGWSWDLG